MKTIKVMKGKEFELKVEKEKVQVETEDKGEKTMKATFIVSEIKIKKQFDAVIKSLSDEKQGIVFFGCNGEKHEVMGGFFPKNNLREEIRYAVRKSVIDKESKLKLFDWIYEPLRKGVYKRVKLVYVSFV
jgi:hypothetical protein